MEKGIGDYDLNTTLLTSTSLRNLLEFSIAYYSYTSSLQRANERVTRKAPTPALQRFLFDYPRTGILLSASSICSTPSTPVLSDFFRC